MTVRLQFFNPREASRESLEALFVVRDPLLDELLADLRRQATSAVRQHWLLKGPRGMGKTHLTALLYHRVRRDAELARAYLPVWLPETAGITAFSVDRLLGQIGQQLAREIEGDRPEDAAALRAEILKLTSATDAAESFEALVGLLRRFANGRTLLVLLENLDVLLNTFGDRRSTREYGHLRALLIEEPWLLLVSTCAVLRLPAQERRGEPLFQHFRERRLEPFDEEQIGALLDRLAQITGRSLGSDERVRERRRVFRRLTGGNPRAVTLGFAAVAGAGEMATIVDEVRALLDAQTPYFEARLAALAPRERAILEEMALASVNLTQQELAERTRLPAKSLPQQIRRLIDDGLVEPTLGEGGKGSPFQFVDGLFRIWLQYRSGRTLLEQLVEFLALYFEPDELVSLDRRLAEESQTEPDTYLVHRVGHEHIRAALSYATSGVGLRRALEIYRPEGLDLEQASDRLPRAIQDRLAFAAASDNRQALRDLAASQLEAVGSSNDSRVEYEGQILLDLIRALHAAGFPAEEQLSLLESLEAALSARSPALRSTALAARLQLAKGGVLGDLGRVQEALAVFADVVSRYGGSCSTELQAPVAWALFNRGVTLGHLGRAEEELAAYAEVVSRYSESSSSELQAQIAMALFNRGVTLGRLGRADEAVAAYEEVVSRYSESSSSELQTEVARALVNQGSTLGELGRAEEELAAYAEVVSRYSESSSSQLQAQVAMALFNRGVTLGRLGQAEEALAAYSEVVSRDSESSSSEVQELIAMALFNRGLTLGRLGRSEEALAAYAEVVSRDSESSSSELQEAVARALVSRGVALARLGRSDEALAAYAEVVSRYSESSSSELQEAVARALVSRGVALGLSGRSEEALAAYAEVVSRYGESSSTELQVRVARALFNRGGMFGRLGRAEEALAAYAEVVSRYSESSSTELHRAVARALVNRGVTLGRLGRSDEEFAAYAEVVSRYGGSSSTELQAEVARALVNRGVTLRELGRSDEALEACAEVVSRYSESSSSELQEAVARALVNRGATLGELGRSDEALEAYAEVVSRYSAIDEVTLDVRLARALVALLARSEDAVLQPLAREIEKFSARRLFAVSTRILAKSSPKWSQRWIGLLSKAGSTREAEAARVLKAVLEVAGPESPATSERSAKARRQRALARVPPEQHDVVLEMARTIDRLRSERAASREPTARTEP